MAMMDVQLNSWLLFEHAPRHFGTTEVVTHLGPEGVHRYTYTDFARRAQQLMHALDQLGIGQGERVATLAWNSYRHLECYFGIPCTGRILHTLNLRLSPAELGWIIADADDRALFVDRDLVPLLERVPEADRRGVERIVVLSDLVPESSLPDLLAYERLLAEQPESYPPPDIDEHSPLGLCYTSGTTGRPKGAVYTHRSTVLHSLAASSAAGLDIGPGDCILPQVPMFHVNAWGMPYAGVATGAKQAFLAGPLDPRSLVDILFEEEVTIAAGVPTVWLAVADELALRGSRRHTRRCRRLDFFRLWNGEARRKPCGRRQGVRSACSARKDCRRRDSACSERNEAVDAIKLNAAENGFPIGEGGDG